MLDKVHLLADGALSDDVISGLEDFKSQFGQHGGHEVGIGVGKQRHGGHQLTAVEVDDLLRGNGKQGWIMLDVDGPLRFVLRAIKVSVCVSVQQ